ncbi:MAG: N-acetylmuramoyl-L-alanine amidase [Candidatus Gracilibacteria bacterium]|jgi:hypothetical protein
MRYKTIKKSLKLLWILPIFMLFAAISVYIKLNSTENPYSQIIKINKELSANSQRLSDASFSIPPYKTTSEFVSDEIKSKNPFTLVGIAYDEYEGAGGAVELYISFNENGKWTNFILLDSEPEKETQLFAKKIATASTKQAQGIKYKFVLYGDGISSPKIKNIEISFIKTNPSVNSQTRSTSPNFVSSLVAGTQSISQLALTTKYSSVISRKTWGADESYRYLSDNSENPDLIEISDETIKKYGDELKYSKVIETDSKGNKYKWPLQYPEKVKKIIIHHSATTSDMDNPKQAVRDIYYYHAMTRGWGDIGYNYVVDKQGNIYEGRFGGEGVIGAHAGIGNNGSIGIAILGNYEESEVPQPVIGSLGKFINQKAKIHKFEPSGKSMFRDENSYNVLGHRDFMSTTCPGKYLYDKLAIVRSVASKDFNEKKKYVKDYDFLDNSATYYVELNPGETKTINITLENIGTKTWDTSTYIKGALSSTDSKLISFPNGKIENLSKNYKNTDAGKSSNFSFDVKAGKSSGTVNLKIYLVANGKTTLNDYIILPISISQGDYDYKFISQNFPNKPLSAGEAFEGWVKLKNTGNVTWRHGGVNSIVLSPDHERGRQSAFLEKGAVKLAILKEKEVAPGETGTFVFSLKAPLSAGSYKEYFSPFMNLETWFSDSGMFFEIVGSGVDTKENFVVDSSRNNNIWISGKSYKNIWFKLKNIGETTWTKDNIKFLVKSESDITVKDIVLATESVEFKKTGYFKFTVDVNKNAQDQKGKILVTPILNGINLGSSSVEIPYEIKASFTPVKKPSPEITKKETVSTPTSNSQTPAPPTSSSSYDRTKEGKIKIKLSFKGDPIISSSEDFGVFNGTRKFLDLKKGDQAKVSLKNDSYMLTVNGKTYGKSAPLSFVPKKSGIMEIVNYENRPAWNLELNDNTYMGKLEIKKDNGSLIVINELYLEDYLKGLGEVSNYENKEKIKTIIIAARTYAKYYTEKEEKFAGKPYDLEDDPNTSQKYIGYGLYLRSPNIVSAVDETRGEVVTYKGELVKTPYFNQSDGTQTKDPKAVWGWSAEYLVPVSDSYCDGDKFLGHGVGLSGCGAKGMAENGFTYKDILKHYYTGVEIKDLY